jgi:hypothetical protein
MGLAMKVLGLVVAYFQGEGEISLEVDEQFFASDGEMKTC